MFDLVHSIYIIIHKQPSPQQTARDQWVAMVDDYIDKESLDILKLSVGSELNETQCQKIKIASDLYCELAQHYTDPEMRLSRFIYALEKLGHRRYGCRAIRHLEERYRPAPFDLAKLKVDMNKFILLQRLTVLCCTLPKDRYDRFSDHLAKKVLANPKKYNTPWKILRKALKKNLITSENHLDVLEEALIEVELSERQIKEAFENFRSIGKNFRWTYNIILYYIYISAFVRLHLSPPLSMSRFLSLPILHTLVHVQQGLGAQGIQPLLIHPHHLSSHLQV